MAFQPSAESLNESKGFQGAAHPQAASSAALDLVLDNNELRRLERRVDLFVQRGLNPQEAGQVALALVGRDRHSGQAVGSCIECQNYVRQQCAVPQAPAVIHECWSRRHDGP